MKKFFVVLLAITVAFAMPVFAATSIPDTTVESYMQGDIADSLNLFLAFYDAGTVACNNTTYDAYVNTNQTGDTSYAMTTPTWNASGTGECSGGGACLDEVATLGADDTHTYTTTGAITTADCAVVYVDLDSNGLETGDVAIYRSDVTEFSVGAGQTFDVTLSGNYLLQVQ